MKVNEQHLELYRLIVDELGYEPNKGEVEMLVTAAALNFFRLMKHWDKHTKKRGKPR